MEELNIYKELNTRYLVPHQHSNKAKVGEDRKTCVLYVIGRFGFSSKRVIEYLLRLPREAINKLFLRLSKDGLINERKSFGSADGAVYYLSAKGKRVISFETELEFHQKTDTSAHNSKTEIHDLSIQVCVIDRLLFSNGQYTAFVTEKELREFGYGSWGILRQQRAVDALAYHAETRSWHALEVETANSKNKKSANTYLRPEILEKYRVQLTDENGLYTRVLFFSHRERFLRQIASRTEEILMDNELNYSKDTIIALNQKLKYIHSFAPMLFNLFWNASFKLEQATHVKIEIDKAKQLKIAVLENKSISEEFQQGYMKALTDLTLIE